jgi:hypothetical protein
MKPMMVSVCALSLLAAEAGPAAAAWNNVYQTTLFGRCHKRTTSAYVAVPAAPCCNTCASPTPCAPTCTTSYVQRCYYQPVQSYQTQTYYEPVTTYRTNYYYEPVTSYRYTSYYDPCSCSCYQVATPVCSYALRAQQCPVQSWVARCVSVPVTTYQKAFYWEPQTTCCQTTVGAPIAAAPAAAPCNGAAPQPAVIPQQPVYNQQPVINQQPVYNQSPGINQPPVINENRGTAPPPVIKDNGSTERYYQRQNFQQPTLGAPPGVRPVTPPPPPVKLDRIVIGPDARVEGQVVRSDTTPRPNARVMFVSADRLAANQTIYADRAGRFEADLSPGGWLVYLDAPDGTQLYHSRIEVSPTRTTAPIRLVNR